MAFAKVRVPRTSQPQGLIPVAPEFAAGKNTLFFGDISRWSPVTNAVTGATPDGLALIGNGSNVGISSTTEVNGYPFTCVLRFNARDVSTNKILMTVGAITGGGHRLQLDVSAGTFRAIAVGSNVVSDTFPISSNKWYTVVYVGESSTNRRLYVDGQQVTTASTVSTFSDVWTKAGICVGFNAGYPNGTAWVNADVSLGYAVQAVLPNELSISVNPWQLFDPEERLIWIPDAVSMGGSATVTPIGQQVTGSVGSPTATGAATTAATGVGAASAVGTPTAIGGASVPATVSTAGVISASSVGTPTAIGASVTSANGVQAISVVGTPTAVAGSSIPATVTPAGVIAHASVGTPSANGASIAYAGGISAFAAVGSPTAIGGVSGQATALPSGVQAIGYVGVPTATAAVVVYASGVQAIGYVGMPIALGDPVAFTPSVYQAISPAQSYTVTSPAQSYTVTVQPQTYIA
jgi:hypothetical protein